MASDTDCEACQHYLDMQNTVEVVVTRSALWCNGWALLLCAVLCAMAGAAVKTWKTRRDRARVALLIHPAPK